jgi:hypothetical protein
MITNSIQFSAIASRPRKPIAERAARVAEPLFKINRKASSPQGEENLSTPCKNSRLRIARRDAWWRAGRVTDYWRARLDWHSALECAQK